jgi:hypothetical protein
LARLIVLHLAFIYIGFDELCSPISAERRCAISHVNPVRAAFIAMF